MKSLTRFILSLLLAMTVSPVLQAAPTHIFNQKNMLSPSYNNFTVDPEGFIWIATDNGLICFDGVNSDLYVHDQNDSTTISDDRVIKVMTDRDGRVWAATANGLNLFHPESESFETVEVLGLDFHGYIIDVFQMSDGQINFIVSGVSFFTVDESSGRPVGVRTMFNYDLQPELSSIGESSNGHMLAGTHHGDLLSIAKNGQVQTFHITDNYFLGIVPDQGDNVIVYTPREIWRWNTKSNTFTPIPLPTGSGIYLSRISRSNDGSHFVATYGNGLYKILPGGSGLVPYTDLYNSIIDINTAKISAIWQDPSGNVWLGCKQKGVVMAPNSPLSFSFIDLKSLYHDFSGGILAVVADNDGTAWVSTEDNVIIHFDRQGRNIGKVTLPQPAYSLLRGSDGEIYVGLSNLGLSRIDRSSNSIKLIHTVRGVYNVPALGQDKNGCVYSAIHGLGIDIYNPNDGSTRWIEKADDSDHFYNNFAVSFMTDSRNRVWIGHYGGLSCLDASSGNLIDLSRVAPQLAESTCLSIKEGADGSVWIGTNNGLLNLNPKSLDTKLYTTADGLSNNMVNDIIFDKEHNACIATANGITRFLTRDGKMQAFYAGNGLGDRKFQKLAAFPGDTLFVAVGESGLTFFNPQRIHPNEFKSAPSFTAFFVNGKLVTCESISGGSKIIQGKFSELENIHVAFDDNSLTFRLSTMDYRDAGNVTYEWRLKGVDDNWFSTQPGESVINLAHLQPGDYTLEVRACENDVYSEVRTTNIHVGAPWYLTTLSKIIYFLILLVIVGLCLMLLRKRQKEELNEERTKLFMNLSHEIRSPMTLVISPIDEMLKTETDPKKAATLRMMKRNANRIVAMMNQLLELRRIDKGKASISCSETELTGFIDEVMAIFKPKAEEKQIDFSFANRLVPPSDTLNVWIDRGNFEKVLFNLIFNALKFTGQGGGVEVSLSNGHDDKMGDYAEISVSDTGTGIDERDLNRIFERFYQSKGRKSSGGMGFGIGLELCREIVTLHHGTISAANRKDVQGSVFTVRVPLGKQHLAATQIHNPESLPEKHQAPAMAIAPEVDAIRDTEAKESRKIRSGKKILVVDDDSEIIAYLTANLGGSARIFSASNGKEALQTITREQIDIIISDVMMPVMDGLALVKSIKTNLDTNHIPVVLLSTKAEIADRVEGWDLGADAYIAKPFDMQEMRAIIDNLLETRGKLRGKFTGAQETAGKVATPEVKGNDQQLIDRIMKVVNEMISDPDLNVESLSDKIGISRAHLNRKMKELMGVSPSDFIRNVRLQKSCEILRQSDIDVTQVAYAVGFTSQSHFSTAFKRVYGMTPREYREQLMAVS